MKWHYLFVILTINLLITSVATPVMASGEKETHQGAYLVLEGKVGTLNSRILVIDGQQYPISIYVRVFDESLTGREMKMQDLVNVGRIDQARLYLIGGKVEKIVVLKNL